MSVIVLAALYAAAEKSCRAAYRKRKTIDGAINWADLHPVSAEFIVELDREEVREFYRVWIEEANADNYPLSQFISAHLAKQGFTDVEVRTEW